MPVGEVREGGEEQAMSLSVSFCMCQYFFNLINVSMELFLIFNILSLFKKSNCKNIKFRFYVYIPLLIEFKAFREHSLFHIFLDSAYFIQINQLYV